MTILMISTDRSIMVEGSPARQRMEEYLGFCKHLHIIILNAPGKETHYGTLSLYPARSVVRYLAPLTAVSLGKNIARTVQIDAITTQDPFETGWVGAELSRSFSLPLHVQVHTDLASPYFRRSHTLNGIRLLLAENVLRRAHAIRTVSLRVKEGLMSAYKGIREPSVLPIYVPPSSFLEGGRRYPFPFTILVVSRLEKEKRISFALGIIAKLMKKYPAIGVLIVGEGRERSVLEKEARKLGISSRVLFEGWRQDVSDVYAQGHVLFVTSGYEGYGRTYLEATDAGLPIISSDVGLMGDVFVQGEGALVCGVEDEKCFLESFTRLMNDLGLRHSLVSHARSALGAHRGDSREYPRKVVEDIARARSV